MKIIISHANQFGTTHRLVMTSEDGEFRYSEQYVEVDGRLRCDWGCPDRKWAAGRLWRIRKEVRDARRRAMIEQRLAGQSV